MVSIGQQKTLTCISRGGNPPAQLVWLKNGRPIGSRYRALRGRTVAEHRLRADVTDLGAVYSCQASSQVQPEPTTASVRTQVNCELYTDTDAPPPPPLLFYSLRPAQLADIRLQQGHRQRFESKRISNVSRQWFSLYTDIQMIC